MEGDDELFYFKTEFPFLCVRPVLINPSEKHPEDQNIEGPAASSRKVAPNTPLSAEDPGEKSPARSPGGSASIDADSAIQRDVIVQETVVHKVI